MKSKKLFEKKIELKNCQINGGRMMDSSKSSSTATSSGDCADVRYSTTDDSGNPINVCVEYSCP